MKSTNFIRLQVNLKGQFPADMIQRGLCVGMLCFRLVLYDYQKEMEGAMGQCGCVCVCLDRLLLNAFSCSVQIPALR